MIVQSTAISREEEQALRNIERAEKDVVTQTQRVEQAQKKYQKPGEMTLHIFAAHHTHKKQALTQACLNA